MAHPLCVVIEIAKLVLKGHTKEDDQGKNGLPPASFWKQSLDLEEVRRANIRALELQEERLAAIRARLSTASSPESVKPDQPPAEDHPPPLKRS